MRLTRRMVVFLVVAALAVTFPLMAQKTDAGKCEKSCAIPNLTAEQSAKIEALKIEHQKTMLFLRADLKAKQLDLKKLMLDKADPKTLDAKIDEMAKVGADIQKKCLAHRRAALLLLTDEQKKAFETMCGGMSCGPEKGHGAGGCGHKMGTAKTGEAAGHGAKGCSEKCGSAAGCDKDKK